MKKALTVFLSLLILIGTITCGAMAEGTSEGEKIFEGVNLRLCMAPMISDDVDKAFWTEKVAPFEEETGAAVTVEIVGWEDMATKYLTAFMSNDAADVLYLTNEIAYDFIDQGCLLELDPYWSEEDLANENFWETALVGGKHFFAPFYGGSDYRGLMYNMDILDECGITELPTTWEELLDVCETIHNARPEIYTYLTGFTGNGSAYIYNLMSYMIMAGGSMVNEEGTAYAFDTDEALKAMNMIKTMADKGYLSTDCLGMDVNACYDLFTEGKVAITMAQWQALNAPEFNWKISTDLHDAAYASFNPIDSICVSANTANPDAAVALLKFVRTADVMMAASEQLCPEGQVLKDYPNTIDDEHMTEVLAHPERSFVLPIAPRVQMIVDSAITNQQLMLMGTLTPEEALAQIQAEADKAFN